MESLLPIDCLLIDSYVYIHSHQFHFDAKLPFPILNYLSIKVKVTDLLSGCMYHICSNKKKNQGAAICGSVNAI